jgi:hypothetical protein
LGAFALQLPGPVQGLVSTQAASFGWNAQPVAVHVSTVQATSSLQRVLSGSREQMPVVVSHVSTVQSTVSLQSESRWQPSGVQAPVVALHLSF